MDKEDVHIHNVVLLSHKKEWNLAIYNNMDGPREYYAKWNKSDRERQIQYDFTYMGNLKKQDKWTNIRNRVIDTENKIGGCQKGGNSGEENNR